MNTYKAVIFDDEETLLTLFVVADTPEEAKQLVIDDLKNDYDWCRDLYITQLFLPEGKGVGSLGDVWMTDIDLSGEDEPAECECDSTHKAVDTVCRWCWARGRRHWNDPEVEDGTSGQDRESYSDNQDRDNYTIDPEWENS